jgi:hypothetical protein
MFFNKKQSKYQPPKKLREWVNDIPDGELYTVYITDDSKVWCTSGRYAHSSGASNTSCPEFLSGELNELVIKTMGQVVLNEITSHIQQQNT